MLIFLLADSLVLSTDIDFSTVQPNVDSNPRIDCFFEYSMIERLFFTRHLVDNDSENDDVSIVEPFAVE